MAGETWWIITEFFKKIFQKMKRKDYEPIKFEFFQSDMEKMMYQLNQVINGVVDRRQLKHIYADLQHKIEIHKLRDEWK
jgi:hypothetical protein